MSTTSEKSKVTALGNLSATHTVRVRMITVVQRVSYG